MKIVVSIEGEEGEVGYGSSAAYASVLQQTADLFIAKNRSYGGAWQEQGYMGNVARILSKSARLKAMLWGDIQTTTASGESVEDTLKDLINISIFALLNFGRRNKWGNR